MEYRFGSECEEGDIILREGWCEHCGQLGWQQPCVSDGLTWWCSDCHYADTGHRLEDIIEALRSNLKGENMFREFVWDYMKEFVEALEEQLKDDEKRWGDTWKKRPGVGQEERIWEHIQTYFDQFFNAGVPVPWLKVAGLAMIAWIRMYEND